MLREAFALSDDGIYLFNNVDGSLMSRSATASVPYHILQRIRKNLGYEMEHWSQHDLRRTARTNFSTLTQLHVAEIMLGHKLPGVWMTYDKHDYLEEQAEAYKKWWERLEEIIGSPHPSE